ncbi:MAG: RNA ligase family protein [Oscillospiraceae bacterium]|nr:RNA ligase family protein [Oscillospiraceae bacterium]
MIINDKRALAYIVAIDEIKPIEGYDRVEYARTNGWWCIISKNDNIKVGDKCVYFEVDSKVNANDERFAFLEKRNYKIKTQKMCKVISQGLLMPLTLFPELGDADINTDVTDVLKVTYAVEEDNARKGKGDPNAKYRSMAARHQKIFKKPWVRWMMRRSWGRKIMFFFFGKKKDNPRGFPTFVSKTDEERVENQPWRIGDGKTYLATEKLDGTSCTYALERKGRNKFEFYVCSRNVRQQDEKQECYHDHNIYWDLVFKYNIEQHLKDFLNEFPQLKWVCIQGEGVGSVQGNPLKLKEDDLYVFNFKDSQLGRWPSELGKDTIESWGMKWVPILGEVQMPNTMEELKQLATGKSKVNPDVMREGIVYRSLDGSDSFKNVSREYLLKHNG